MGRYMLARSPTAFKEFMNNKNNVIRFSTKGRQAVTSLPSDINIFMTPNSTRVETSNPRIHIEIWT